MAEVALVDVSFRDGNQSLWGATGVRTRHVLAIAPVVERVGFHALDFTSSTHMGVAVRTHREDPWERIRLTRAAMPETHLQFIGTGFRFISWERAHPAFMRLVYERLVANGMSRFMVLDPMHDIAAVRETAETLRAVGAAEVVAALTFTISDVHDDAHYADLAGQMAACDAVDRLYLKDPSGLLTPERAETLIPAVLARIGDRPLELHSHCTLGLSPRTSLRAVDLGIGTVHVGCGPLGNGTSLPEARRLIANLRETGHTVDVDDALLDRVCDYFARLADAEGLPHGAPRDFDATFLRHQVAGGVMTTLRRQLREIGHEDRFDQVLDEVVRVRAELGYPIMVTPFPQIVCSQALYNVIGDRRYGTVADQTIRYVLGTFGRPAAPIDAGVREAILSRPRADELSDEAEPEDPDALRARLPDGIGDEEFLLRAVMPAEEVDAMRAAGPAQRNYNPDLQPVLALLDGLRDRPPVTHLTIDKPDFRLTLRAGDAGAGA